MEIKKSPKADLQNKRGLLLEIGLVVALILVIAAFAYTPKEHRIEKVDLNYGPVEEEITEITRQDQKPPEPPKKVEVKVIADLLQVYGSGREQAPRRVQFRWGTLIFNGVISQHQEVFDYFSPSGVPLRSKVSLTLTEQEFRYEVSATDAARRRQAVEQAKAVLNEIQHLSAVDRERLFGYLEGTGKMILVEPGYLLTPESKMPGLDGQKMSKSYHNTITMRESEESVAKKVKSMPTDTNRVRRTDPGDPARCPVWQLHQVYSDDSTKEWASHGCKTAGIGCIECKQPVIDGILKEQVPMRERAQMYLDDPTLVKNIIADGCEKARELARETMRDVREAMGLEYH